MYIIHTVYIYTYISFSTTLDKGLRKDSRTKKDGEIGKHMLNALGALNIK